MKENEKGGKVLQFPTKPKGTTEKEPVEGVAADPVSLGKHRLGMQNEGRRTDVVFDPVNDQILLPEEMEIITLEEALEIAQKMVELYDPENYRKNFEKGNVNFPLDEAEVGRFKDYARLSTTDLLRRFFGWHKKNPTMYPPARLYAEACVLLERFPNLKD